MFVVNQNCEHFWNNVEVLLDEVMGINSDQRVVHLTRGDMVYDFLILATGIQYNVRTS